MANTGYLIQPRLKRVTDDVNEFPLDENDNLCSETGLPQATIDNPTDSPTYRVLNTTTCPINPSDEVTLTVNGFYDVPTQTFSFQAEIDSVLTNDLEISFIYSFKDSDVVTVGNTLIITITAGMLTGSTTDSYSNTGLVTDIQCTIDGVTPNPNGGKTIIY